VAPLVRPLIAAGVPAVIGSLWDVNDATAEALLVSFHRHYGQGLDAAAAMQAAQVEMIRNTKNTGFQRPMAWAPFQVIGYSASPASAARHN
jgi:CHAT domain-containing protein